MDRVLEKERERKRDRERERKKEIYRYLNGREELLENLGQNHMERWTCIKGALHNSE